MKSGAKPRPLWRCPKCGKYYVTRNMWHACARHTLAEHFARRDPKLKLLFQGFAGVLRRCGLVRIVPDKTRIAFQARMRFAGVTVRRNCLEAGFPLPRRIEHPRFRQILSASPGRHYHYLRISSPAELDREVRAWLREAYRAG